MPPTRRSARGLTRDSIQSSSHRTPPGTPPGRPDAARPATPSAPQPPPAPDGRRSPGGGRAGALATRTARTAAARRDVLLARLEPEHGAAWGGFLRVHARLTAVLDAELRAAHDTPLAWFDALFQLALAPDGRRRLTDLGARVLLTPSGISRLVDRLEAEGLVARAPDPSDGRATAVALTPAGWARLEAVHATHVAGIQRHFVARLRPAELRALAAAWRRILEAESGDG
jgi:DNA-binding MarR family transcriptional regulator